MVVDMGGDWIRVALGSGSPRVGLDKGPGLELWAADGAVMAFIAGLIHPRDSGICAEMVCSGKTPSKKI